jgi:hypothetical protein
MPIFVILQVFSELLLDTPQHSHDGGVIGGILAAQFVDEPGR